MNSVHTVLTAAAFIAGAFATGCAPPAVPDYDAPDASIPDDAPKVVSVSPKSGAEDVNRQPVIRIKFDKQLDARTIENSSFSLVSGPSGRWLTSYYDPFRKELLVWPAGYLFRQCTWVFEIRKGLLGTNGLPVAAGIATSFRTGDDIIFETPYHVRSFKDDISPIFETHCISCHGGPDAVAGLKLDTEDNIASTVISQPSVGRSNWDVVVPTQPGLSYLLYKLGDPSVPGMQMPRALNDDETALPLSGEEKQALVDWIAVGAVFFDPDPQAE